MCNRPLQTLKPLKDPICPSNTWDISHFIFYALILYLISICKIHKNSQRGTISSYANIRFLVSSPAEAV